MESELTWTAAFGGITFARMSGLQSWANSCPAKEKPRTTRIATQSQYFKIAPWLAIYPGRYLLLAPYFSREEALFIASSQRNVAILVIYLKEV